MRRHGSHHRSSRRRGWSRRGIRSSAAKPHRVVVELEDEDGAPVSASVPCELGGITLDVRHWGIYRGRIYAWTLGPEIRSVMTVRLEIDSPILWWTVETPR